MILANHGIISSAGGLPPSTLLTNLYAVYKAESNANDSLGVYNGTAQGGLTYSAGKSGNAFTFNGSNAYVSLPNNSLNFTGDFSISLWVNLASLSGVQYLFNNFKQVGLTNYYGYIIFAYNNYIYFRNCDGSLNTHDTITPFSSTNSWSNIVIIRKTSVTNKIYINGVLAVSGGAVNPVYDSVMPYSRIGSYNDSNGDKFLANGSKIDEVGLWNRELTQSEITELQTKYYPF